MSWRSAYAASAGEVGLSAADELVAAGVISSEGAGLAEPPKLDEAGLSADDS